MAGPDPAGGMAAPGPAAQISRALRDGALALLRSPAGDAATRLGRRLVPTRPDRLAVLTYHRVDEPARRPWLYPGLISAAPDQFEEQIRFLAREYQPVSLDQLLARRDGGPALPPGAVMVTVDDAYEDLAEHAWPVLRRHGVPVTLFVPTAYPDSGSAGFWWDRVHAALSAAAGPRAETPFGELALGSAEDRRRAIRRVLDQAKQMPHRAAMAAIETTLRETGAPTHPASVLSWSDLRDLRRDGVTLAPHSRTHAMLDRLDAEDLAGELGDSLAELSEQVGPVPPVLAYPSGRHNPEVVRATAAAGYALAFTTARGGNAVGSADWLRLRRINIGPASTVPVIRAQLVKAQLAS